MSARRTAEERDPDAALTPDPGTALDYPFGERAPGPGEIIPLADGIGWARLAMPGSLAHINIWVLDEDDGSVTIVDTGMRHRICKEGWAALFAGPLAGRRVSRVIATHLHPDHVGLAGWLCHKHQATLWMTRGEWLTIRMLAADARDEVPAEMQAFWRAAGWDDAQIAAASARGWGRIAQMIAPLPLGYRRIRDGEAIRIGARDWRVVVGSGHSPEHACLLNEADDILIAGDQLLPKISSNVSLGVTEPEADPLGEWLASLDRLDTLDPGLLVCPSHGEVFRGLVPRVAALRQDHLDRLGVLEAHLAHTPSRAVDVFPLLFRRAIDDSMRGLATGEALAHLRHLEVTGRARRETRDGIWWYSAG
ncbi:MBL fold metallo-hydrolase [Sphingomonas gilva]|uniref:MBL fold metallo-hydrolase n=1 Tax=Sphingomonas gilva TaxID=2305907 RepID=A0A396RQK1_9SPHN|nr:MBL fold metallo-hydrolase [Sphingomonas gilva]RHW18884.1 MBL fold metallo-hydrolase [Sphingomonas gilva]